MNNKGVDKKTEEFMDVFLSKVKFLEEEGDKFKKYYADVMSMASEFMEKVKHSVGPKGHANVDVPAVEATAIEVLEIKEDKKMENAFEPKIVGFLCNWCSYAGADKAGSAQQEYPTNVRIVKVMCSGRVDPAFVLKAFEQGADGVMILACHPGDCHYKEGNYRAAQRYQILKRLIAQLGIEDERCYFDYVSAGEGDKFVKVITETVEKVKALGPLKLKVNA